jgi:hypothetical protein
MKDQSKLIHDINSGLSSICQAIELINSDQANTELLSQVSPLALEKITQVLSDWKELKDQIRS